MQPLLRFLLKYYNTFLFFLLEILAFVLIVNNNYYQQSVYVSASNSISGKMYELYNGVTQYFSLKATNKILAEENAQLLSKQIGAFLRTDNKVFVVNDTLYQQEYNFISAKVISNSINRVNNYLTLNKGYKSGIKKNMGVISSKGIVGIVRDVTENFCSVTSILHSKSRISAKLKKGNNLGTIIWNGTDHKIATLKDVPTHVKVSIGDTVISSGFSLMFPEGIIIGTVYSYDINKGKDFLDIKVKLFIDLNSISYVYIITNLMKNELNELEARSQNE